MSFLFDPEIWAAFLTLSALEIVLGVDNIIFISIIAGKVPLAYRRRVRMIGLAMALLMRIALLSSIVWIIGLTEPIATVGDFAFSWRDLILLAGGLFLLWKATVEIHSSVEGLDEGHDVKVSRSFALAVAQIALIDLVFSLDSIITAVGMSDNLGVMIAAVCVAILVMLLAAEPVGNFVLRHATVKMLALSFLLLVGMALVADGLHFHVPRSYLYFAIAFSIGVESLNLLARARAERKRAAATPPHG
ncbi:MAG: TerC family protein [Alphaproteobacteria bacterium]|nr:TerC family protein [Alphaproteobacteria bacterium]